MFLIFVGCKLENRTVQEKTAEIPQWVYKLYEFQNERGEFQKVYFFKQLNDSVSYCVFTKSEGFSCSTSYVVTHINKKEFQKTAIANKCDIDYSLIKNTYSLYKVLKPNIIKSINYTSTVPDSLITDNGEIKRGIDLLNIEREIDSTFQFYKVSRKGKIVKK